MIEILLAVTGKKPEIIFNNNFKNLLIPMNPKSPLPPS